MHTLESNYAGGTVAAYNCIVIGEHLGESVYKDIRIDRTSLLLIRGNARGILRINIAAPLKPIRMCITAVEARCDD